MSGSIGPLWVSPAPGSVECGSAPLPFHPFPMKGTKAPVSCPCRWAAATMRIRPVWSRLGPELVLRLSGSTVSVRTVPPGLSFVWWVL